MQEYSIAISAKGGLVKDHTNMKIVTSNKETIALNITVKDDSLSLLDYTESESYILFTSDSNKNIVNQNSVKFDTVTGTVNVLLKTSDYVLGGTIFAELRLVKGTTVKVPQQFKFVALKSLDATSAIPSESQSDKFDEIMSKLLAQYEAAVGGGFLTNADFTQHATNKQVDVNGLKIEQHYAVDSLGQNRTADGNFLEQHNTTSITLYVSQLTGSDTNLGLSEQSPLKTLKKAISLFTRNTGAGHTIQLDEGDYRAELINRIQGIVGQGRLIIRGKSGVPAQNIKLHSLEIDKSLAGVRIENLSFWDANRANANLVVNENSGGAIEFTNCKFDGNNKTLKAVDSFRNNSIVIFIDCAFDNFATIVNVSYGYIIIDNCVGVNNNIGLSSVKSSTIEKRRTQPTATVPEVSNPAVDGNIMTT